MIINAGLAQMQLMQMTPTKIMRTLASKNEMTASKDGTRHGSFAFIPLVAVFCGSVNTIALNVFGHCWCPWPQDGGGGSDDKQGRLGGVLLGKNCRPRGWKKTLPPES